MVYIRMINIITDRKEPILHNYKLINGLNNQNVNMNIHIFIKIRKLLRYIPEKYKQMIVTFHNKHTFHKFMIKNNLANNVPKKLSKPEFPCIIKPYIGMSGSNTIICSNQNEWNNVQFNMKTHMLQKYIMSNYIYTCHVICNHGIILMAKVYWSLKPTPMFIQKGSMVNYQSREINNNEKQLFSKIIELNKYHGVCCVDYDYENETIKIFEINPRFGGSLINNQNDFLLFVECMIVNNVVY